MVMEQSFSEELAPVYRRELPGGGYVAIDVKRGRERGGGAGHEPARCRVSVERRARHDRRVGHRPIVIAEVDGDEQSPVFAELYRMAADNAAIARALLQLEGRAD
jgi:hypothetical protein